MTEATLEMTGAESVAWNLTDMYAGPDDPAITRDLDACDARSAAFNAKYRGHIGTLDATALLAAITEYESISELITKLNVFAYLQWTINTSESKYGALLQKITERG